MDRYGKKGVKELEDATPKDTGKTSESWSYDIEETKTGYVLSWSNSNRVNGILIAILIQYDHGTGNGGFVQGIDYINPAMKPIFDDISKEITKELARI